MQIEQKIWTQQAGWSKESDPELRDRAQIAFVFGSTPVLKNGGHYESIKESYPQALIIGCSTSGEIASDTILDESIVVTALHFEHTELKRAEVKTGDFANSTQAGKALIDALPKENLVHVLVFSDGLNVNGSDLVRGLQSGIPEGVGLTGGLAGDGDRFTETLVCADAFPEKEKIVLVGFYGDRLKVGYGSMSGFSPFGPERRVTKARGNVLYELDGESALDLYKKYLGEEKASNLEVNQFYFPLSYKAEGMDEPVIRTILSIDEKEKSMTFAGDILEGGHARLMKANHHRLIDGAGQAAETCVNGDEGKNPEFAILISCVGRKIVLKQRAEEEIDIVRNVFDDQTVLTGFYSYGEIAHFRPFEPCQLHNQTMTITTFMED